MCKYQKCHIQITPHQPCQTMHGLHVQMHFIFNHISVHLQSLKIFNLVSVVLIINRHITKSSWEMWDSHRKCVTLNSCLCETAFQRVHISAAICTTSPNDKDKEDKWQVVLRCENYCAFKAAWETKPQNDFLWCFAQWCDGQAQELHAPWPKVEHQQQDTLKPRDTDSQHACMHAYGQLFALSTHLDTTAWACLSH